VLPVGALAQLQVANVSQGPRVYWLDTTDDRKMAVRARLFPGTPEVTFPGEPLGPAYTVAHLSRNFTADLSTSFFLVRSTDEIERLMDKPNTTRPILAITNISANILNASFPVLTIFDANMSGSGFWDYVYNNSDPQSIIVGYREYRDVRLNYSNRASFSSLGPSYSGLIKPDIMAPGEAIVSAHSVPDGDSNHDADPFDGYAMQGTSMATPNAAGSAALVTQYFRDFYHLTPSASLIYATLINSADPPSSNPEPNVEMGFGMINLGRHLPLAHSLLDLAVADGVNISDRQHLVARVNVTSLDTEFRVTIAFRWSVSCHWLLNLRAVD
jgi:hypothetical protein